MSKPIIVPKNSKVIEDALIAWQTLADDERRAIELGIHKHGCIDVARNRIDCYERTVEALRIELQTGIAVCSCCHKPYGGGNRILLARDN